MLMASYARSKYSDADQRNGLLPDSPESCLVISAGHLSNPIQCSVIDNPVYFVNSELRVELSWVWIVRSATGQAVAED